MSKKNRAIITKKEMLEYDGEVRKRAKKFKLTPRDFHNLFDLYWMSDHDKDLWKILKINKMDRWFHNFTHRVERILFNRPYALKRIKE